VFAYPALISKYSNGIDLWEMGYRFADSVGTHAPALNMHLAVIPFILFFISFKTIKRFYNSTLYFILFLVLYNTRIALLNVLIEF
jgi:hypothetical protein